VVRGNLMRMWRVYDIEEITKINSGIYYFKFKSEEEDELPNILEIEYPPLGNRPARVGKLEVKYQWRPPLCTHCKTFGHTMLSHKVRPRTEEEIAAKTLRDVLKVGNSDLNGKGKTVDVNDGFTLVGNGNFGGKFINVGHRRGGGLVLKNQFHQNSNFDSGSMKAGRKYNNNNKPSFQEGNKKPIVDKPVLASTFNHKFRPKVLVRGSGSARVMDNSLKEVIPVKNSFDVLNSEEVNGEDLGGINVNEEFNSKVWPELKEEVDILMEAGIYPSKQVRLDWSIHQLDYFYKNCNKFHLDPICEDDEEDVESEVEGIAGSIKLEFEVKTADSIEINAVDLNRVSNDV
nr:hypothetical protein [Tanacetum cinerariifolium]